MNNSDVDVDYVSSCAEEIALEGLDGITLSGLWLRLQDRSRFPLVIDDPCKQWLWTLIAPQQAIQFFQLPQPRGALAIGNRFETTEIITGVLTKAEDNAEDIYPISIVKGANVQGSCATYQTRVDVTDEIRDAAFNLKMSLLEVEEKWGESLVLVSSQEERIRALLGPRGDPQVAFPDLMYCVLERIGRSRGMGEVTSGKLSMTCICEPKTLFYMRNKLWKMNLITQQVFHHRVGTTRFRKCVLLHLTRFSNRRKSALSLMLSQVYSMVNSKPNRCEVAQVVFDKLGLKDDAVKKFVKSHLNCLAEVVLLPLREVFPNLPDEGCFYASGNERCVKMIRLLDHVTEANFDEKVSASEKCDFEEEDDSQEESAASSASALDAGNQFLDKSLLRQSFELIEKSGSKGLYLRDLVAFLGIRSMDFRLLHKGLLATNMVSQVPTYIGKQKAYRLISNRYCNKTHVELVEECRKFLQVANITDKTEGPIAPFKSGFLNEVLDICWQTQPTMQGTLNVRMVRRARRILEMTKATKVIESPNIIHAALVEDEAGEGIGKVDKKTVLRVIYWLINDGLVKSLKTTLKFGAVEKKIHMICDTAVSVKDEVFQNALQIAKFKNFAIGSTEAKASVKKRAEKKEGPKPKMEYVARIGYTYGHEPKFLRMKTIHKFLCYLAFDYDGGAGKVTEEDRKAIEAQLPDGYTVPTIYHGKVSWKTFIPPLPPHDDWPKRWILLSDVLLRLPLSIFVKIINVTFKIDGLMEYLEHPIKKHFLVSQIPTDMRNILLFARKYIFNAHELATKLSYMGLLSFSPNIHKEKDQVFLYIHRNTTLKDTKTSKPGYMTISPDDKYEVLVFTLDTLEDVDLFWQTLEDICARTPLGLFTAAMGQSVTVELPHKKQCLMECSRPKAMDQVTDDGRVPGDGLGAGGLDSSLFAHLRRNWLWINVDLTRKKTDGERKGGKMAAESNKENNGAGQVARKRLARLSDKKRTLTVQRQQKNSEAGTETATVDGKTVKITRGRKRKASTDPKWKKTKKVRTVKRRALRRVRRPFHDEIDKEALRRMRNLRVTWADKEDSFLLLCKVASLLLDPVARTLFVSGSIIRDLIHKRWPQLSMNKTSHACQRRIRYMLLKPETIYNVSVFVGEAKQDEEIMELCNVPKPLRTNEEACRDVFLPVLTKLQDKFKVQASGLSTALELPSTMAELESKYSLMLSDKFVLKDSRHHDVKNVVDIHCSVAYTFLTGALAVDKDKSNWSYHLYRILQQYPDNLLRSVFVILRADFLVCIKKKMARAAKGFSLASIPYKLSLKFHRTFATLINDEVYTEASTLMGQIREDALAGCPGQGVPVHNDNHGGFATVFEACVAAKRITHTLYVADQVLVVDKDAFSKSREAGEEWKAGLRDWQGVSESEEGTMKEKDEEGKKEDGAVVPQDSTMQMEPVTNASRFALYMLRQQMTAAPGNRHNLPELMTVQLCPVHCHVKQTTAPFVLPKNLVDAFEAQISRMIPSEIATFEMFLQPMEDLDEVTALRNLYNEIVQHKELGIKEPDLEGMFRSEEYEALHGRMKVLVDGHQVIRVGVTVPRYVAMVHGRPWILDTVRVSKEEKAEALEKTQFLSGELPSTSAQPGSLERLEGPEELERLEGLGDKTVVTEGSDTRSSRPRRNSIKVKHHDIQKDFGQMDRKVVRLIYRPWRKPDGTVNRQMLNQMLRGVAGQVMFHPGISLDNLCEKFLPALQPVQVMELVDMLVDVGCFHRCFLKTPPVASAFSRPQKISVTDRKCGPNDTVFLEADVECIPKLTQLLRLHPWSKGSRGSEFEQEHREMDVFT